MGVFKRPDSRFYWYRFIFDGDRIQKSTQQGDRQEAINMESAERTRLARVRAGLEPATPKAEEKIQTVGELLAALLQHYEREGKASKQNMSTIAVANREFGIIKTVDLTKSESMTTLTAGSRKKVANATINRVTEIVAVAFKVAKLPAPEMRHMSEKDNARQGFLTVPEFENFVKYLPEDLQDFCRFAYTTGWRLGEVKALRWQDVEDGVVRLRGKDSKNRESRHVPIEGELIEIFKRRRKARTVITPAGIMLAAEFVFHRDGEQVGEFRKSWATACIAAELGWMVCPKCGSKGTAHWCKGCKTETRYKGRTFHDFRRSAVRNMVRGGVPQSVAMKISGHKTASMFKRYDISDEKDLTSAMRNIERYHAAEQKKVIRMKASR